MKSNLRVMRSHHATTGDVAMAVHRVTRAVAHVRQQARPVPAARGAARVGYLLDHFPSRSHGFVLQEILELESRGIDVQVFSLGIPDGFLDDTATALARLHSPVCYFSADAEISDRAANGTMFAGGMTSRAAHWMARHVAARNIEHLHAHGASETADVVREAGGLTGVGYSFTVHAQDLNDRAAPAVCEKVLEARFAVTLSDVDHNRLNRICGRGAADKLHRIPMSVDPDEFRFSKTANDEWPSILTIGPLAGSSGFDDLIDAIRILRDCGRLVHLTIVGDGGFDEALRARIDRAGLSERVRVIANASRRELAMLMREHTVLALPWTVGDADREVLANLVLEAMAGGLPVLSTDVPSIRELIDDGLTGRLISARDPSGLAGALETFFGNPRLCESFAAKARTTVERVFTARDNVSRLANLFVDAVARPQLGF